MKSILLGAIFILFCFTCFGQNLKALDDKYGFREVKFETPITAFKNLKKNEYDPSFYQQYLNYFDYKKNDENLKIGQCNLKDISYCFYKDKLMSVDISVEPTYSDTEELLKIFEIAYGKPKIEIKVPDKWIVYHWKGEKAEISYEILYKKPYEPGEANVSISSITLSNTWSGDLMRKEDQARVKAASEL